jgi:hypothetical protein
MILIFRAFLRLFVAISVVLATALFPASAGEAPKAGSTLRKIQSLIQSAPSTTNLQALEIFDTQAQTNALLPIRKDVLRLPYFNEGGAAQIAIQILQLPQLNRFYIQEATEPPRYYGPFEGEPFKMLAGAKREKPVRAGPPRVNAVPPEQPDNPLGLDLDTIARLFETGKLLRNVAPIAAQWAAAQRRIPATLNEVYAQYINRDELANDPFGDSKLEIKNAVGRIQIYSIGPDGIWDEGKPVFPDDPSLTGDIGIEIDIPTRNTQWLLDGPLVQYLEGNHTARYLAAKAKRSQPVPALNRVDGNLIYGKAVDGLSAAVELTPKNGVFSIDQPIEVHFHIRNETNYDIPIASSSFRQGDKPIVEDDRGLPLNVGVNSYSGISPTQREILKPSQTVTFRSSGLEFVNPQTPPSYPVGYTVITKPGRYTVRAKLFFPGWNAQLMDWQGELETAPVSVNVQAGAGKPSKSAR